MKRVRVRVRVRVRERRRGWSQRKMLAKMSVIKLKNRARCARENLALPPLRHSPEGV